MDRPVETAMIGVGLVGFGVAGRTFHAPIISAVPDLRLACVVKRGGGTLPEPYQGVRVTHSLGEMLADPAIELAIIATPNPTHFELAKQCLEAGRHVVVDKPFTVTSGEAAELIAIADRRKRVLSVYQNRRYDGDFGTVRELIGSGSLGRIVSLESHYDRFRPQLKEGAWRERDTPGSGVLYDLGAHLIDQALVLFGSPGAITADLRIERDHAVVTDAFDLTLHYAHLSVLLRASMLAAQAGPRFVVRGTLGSYVKHGFDPQEETLKQGASPNSVGWGEEPSSAWGTLSDGKQERMLPTRNGDYRQYYENIRDAILGKASLQVTALEAWRVVRLIELAQQSSQQRRAIDCDLGGPPIC